jgi:hypothetical protein
VTLGPPKTRSLSQGQLDRIRVSLRQGLADAERRPVSPSRALLAKRWVLVMISLVFLLAVAGVVGTAIALRASGIAPAAKLEDEWRHELEVGVAENPKASFDNLSPDELKDRLAVASRKDGFTVVSLTLLKPKGIAPLVVVKTDDEARFSEQLPAILRGIDPKKPGGDDRTGWSFEGFFLKAVDKNDDPFLVVFNFWRGDNPGGGQWARSEAQLPFPHG